MYGKHAIHRLKGQKQQAGKLHCFQTDKISKSRMYTEFQLQTNKKI